MIPGTFMYVYLGHVAGQAAAGDGQRTAGEWVLLIVGLLATVAVTVYITHLAKRNLAEQTERGGIEETTAADEGGRPTRVMGHVILAVVLLALALLAHFQSDALVESLQRMIGTAAPASVHSDAAFVQAGGTSESADDPYSAPTVAVPTASETGDDSRSLSMAADM
jgi:hypothetical protein